MVFDIDTDGNVEMIFSESFDVESIGELGIPKRASFVEPTAEGWLVDLSPVNGPTLGPFSLTKRSEALAAEVAWLEANYL